MTRKITLKKLLLIAGIVCLLSLIVMGGLSFVLFTFFPRDQIKTAITRDLSSRLGLDVVIESISLGFYPDIELVAERPEIIDPATSQTVISAANARFDVGLYRLLKRDISIENIIVNVPHLQLARNEDKVWDIEKTVNSIKSRLADPRKKTDKKTMVRGFNISPIRIRNGRISVHDESSGKKLEVNDIALTIDFRNDLLQLQSASIVHSPIYADVSGEISDLTKSTRVLDCSAKIRVRNEGALSDLNIVGLAQDASLAEGVVDLSGNFENVAIESALSINRIATKGFPTKGTMSGNLLTREGVLDIANGEISFGGSSMKFKGRCTDLWTDNRVLDLDGTTDIFLAEIGSLVDSEFVSELQLEGKTTGPLKISGPIEKVNINTLLDLFDAGITLPHLMRKAPGSPASLRIDACYAIGDEVVIDDFEFIVGKSELKGSAHMKAQPKREMRASLHASDFALTRLDQLPGGSFTKGALAIDAEVWQPGSIDGQLQHSGEMRITNGSFSPHSSDRSVENIDAKMRWKEENARVESLAFSLGQSRFLANGEISGFEKPYISGTISTNLLDLEQISSTIPNRKEDRKEGEKTPSTPSGRLDKVSLELLLKADEIYAGRFRAGASSGTWRISEGTHRLEPLLSDFSGGKLNGSLALDTRDEITRWTMEFEGKQIKLAQLLEQSQSGKTKVKGALDIWGSLSGSLMKEPHETARSINGQIEFTARDGEIKQYALLKTIFLCIQMPLAPMLIPGLREITVLNTLLDAAKTRGRSLNPTTTTFEKISGCYDIKGGMAHTDDMLLESGMAHLTFKGDVDLAEKQMDMKIRATPLGSIGSLMGKVPVAGDSIKKTKDKAFSIDFIARGPLDDPKVRLASLEKISPQNGPAVSLPEMEE